jgi:hypothetical protein
LDFSPDAQAPTVAKAVIALTKERLKTRMLIEMKRTEASLYDG